MSKGRRKHTPSAGARRGLSKGWSWALVLAVLVGFVGYLAWPAWWPGQRGAGSSPAAIALGEQVFGANCATCHGAGAEGQMPSQPMGGTFADGTYIAPALNGTGHMWHHPPAQLSQIVTNGSPDPTSPMKGFAGRLSEQEIEAVLAYLQSRWPERLRERYRDMHAMHSRG
jgi:mono/diheme cytochrome c family protein